MPNEPLEHRRSAAHLDDLRPNETTGTLAPQFRLDRPVHGFTCVTGSAISLDSVPLCLSVRSSSGGKLGGLLARPTNG